MGVSWGGDLSFGFDEFPVAGFDFEEFEGVEEVHLLVDASEHEQFVVAVEGDGVLYSEGLWFGVVVVDGEEFLLVDVSDDDVLGLVAGVVLHHVDAVEDEVAGGVEEGEVEVVAVVGVEDELVGDFEVGGVDEVGAELLGGGGVEHDEVVFGEGVEDGVGLGEAGLADGLEPRHVVELDLVAVVVVLQQVVVGEDLLHQGGLLQHRIKQEMKLERKQNLYVKQEQKVLKASVDELHSQVETWRDRVCCCKRREKDHRKDLLRIRQKSTFGAQEQQIYKVLNSLMEEEQLRKAARHYQDALLLRTPRHDIDLPKNAHALFFWKWIHSPLWGTLLWSAAFLLQLLTFFEPSNSKDRSLSFQAFETTVVIEGAVLLLISVNNLLTLLFCFHIQRFQMSKINLFELLFFLALAADYAVYVTSYPRNVLRFSRVLRPVLLIVYSKDLRRTCLGIIGSTKDLLIFFLFYLFFMAVWAFLGINIIGEIQEVVLIDTQVMDYSDFFKLFNMLYMLSILDYYPDIMMAPYQVSSYYSLYFVIFIFLFLFILMPIPLALVYESFKNYRIDILIKDRIKQRDALFSCFLCIDTKCSGAINRASFIQFIKTVYEEQLSDQEIQQFYELIDDNQSDRISIEEFFNIIQITDENKKFQLEMVQPLKVWIQLRKFLLIKFDILNLVDGLKFQLFIIVVTIVNCILIISSVFMDVSSQPYKVVQLLDHFFFGIYTIEFLLKIIAYSIKGYFDDGWNTFDFILLMFQLLFDYILYNLLSKSFVDSMKANRLLKLAKIQKMFRLFRAFRTIKVMKIFLVGMDIFNKVKDLIIKILICIPIVLKQSLVVWILFYIYAIISLECFTTIGQEPIANPYGFVDCSDRMVDYSDEDERRVLKSSSKKTGVQTNWSSCDYASFNSFEGALLLLVQIFTGDMSTVIFMTGYERGELVFPSIFFGSFVFFQIFLLALISGLVWEIFTVLEDLWKVQRDQEREQLERQELEQQMLEELEEQEALREELKPKNSLIINTDGCISVGSVQHSQSNLESVQQKNDPENFNFLSILEDRDPDAINFSESDEYREKDTEPYRRKEEEVQEEEGVREVNETTPKVFLEGVQSPGAPPPTQKKGNHVQFGYAEFRRNSEPYANRFEMLDESEESEVDEVQEFIEARFMALGQFRARESRKCFDSHEQKMNDLYLQQIKENLLDQESRHEPVKDFNMGNHAFLINNALLKGANQHDIRKAELNHFYNVYGSQFEIYREMKVLLFHTLLQLTALMRVQASLLYNLNCSLKYHHVNFKFVFQLLLSLEYQISNELLSGGSFCKLLFQNHHNHSFFLTIYDGKFRLKRLTSKIWAGLKKGHEEMVIAEDIFNFQKGTKRSLGLKKEMKKLMYDAQEMGQSLKPKIWLRKLSSLQYYCLVDWHENEHKEEVLECIREKYATFLKSFSIEQVSAVTVESIQLVVFLSRDENENALRLFKEDSFSQNSPADLDAAQEVSTQISQERFKYDDQYPYLPFGYALELVKDLNSIIANHKKNLFHFFSQMVHLRKTYDFLTSLEKH